VAEEQSIEDILADLKYMSSVNSYLINFYEALADKQYSKVAQAMIEFRNASIDEEADWIKKHIGKSFDLYKALFSEIIIDKEGAKLINNKAFREITDVMYNEDKEGFDRERFLNDAVYHTSLEHVCESLHKVKRSPVKFLLNDLEPGDAFGDLKIDKHGKKIKGKRFKEADEELKASIRFLEHQGYIDKTNQKTWILIPKLYKIAGEYGFEKAHRYIESRYGTILNAFKYQKYS